MLVLTIIFSRELWTTALLIATTHLFGDYSPYQAKIPPHTGIEFPARSPDWLPSGTGHWQNPENRVEHWLASFSNKLDEKEMEELLSPSPPSLVGFFILLEIPAYYAAGQVAHVEPIYQDDGLGLFLVYDKIFVCPFNLL